MLYNRDVSWLAFNLRVLHEAADEDIPLFERIKFLSIFSSNLDEFFRVRYPLVIALTKLKSKTQRIVSIDPVDDLPEIIQGEINRQLNLFGSTLTRQIIPSLKKHGIWFYYNEAIKEIHQVEVREIFLSKVLSFIQPLYMDNNMGKAFYPENNLLYLVVTLKNPDNDLLRHAVVNIPSDKLPRFFVLSKADGYEHVIFIDDIVRQNMEIIFPGQDIFGIYSVKFNRDAELHLEDEYSKDVLGKIEKQLRKRDFGPPSRFLYQQDMPRNLQLFLASMFQLKFEEMFAGGRYHHLSDLSKFPEFDRGLTYKKLAPHNSALMQNGGDIFQTLGTREILLHLPYDSYNPVLSFFNQAAVDPQVTEIYITLYRVAAESHIANALISAARNGKKVTAFIELKARFDEANNIKWSRKMKEAGIQLIFSVPQIKVHSKIALVSKTSGGQSTQYAILSTGNFHEITAQFYTDHVLMTTDSVIINELQQLLKYLQKDMAGKEIKKPQFNFLLVSQFNMVNKLEELLMVEIEKARRGETALVRIKVNNLEEPKMIKWLYKASQEGVTVQLIVRSICCIVPGMPGLSDNITVTRLVDRYLEHSRLFIFGEADNAVAIMGSADLMARNLYHRVEVCVPIKDNNLKKELIDYFTLQWNDTQKAVRLSPRHEIIKRIPEPDQPPLNAQTEIYNYLQKR
jgi:polyphosphate kinase